MIGSGLRVYFGAGSGSLSAYSCGLKDRSSCFNLRWAGHFQDQGSIAGCPYRREARPSKPKFGELEVIARVIGVGFFLLQSLQHRHGHHHDSAGTVRKHLRLPQDLNPWGSEQQEKGHIRGLVKIKTIGWHGKIGAVAYYDVKKEPSLHMFVLSCVGLLERASASG